MKYLRQTGVILVVTFVGEILKSFLPFPVPASIYGLVLMLGLLIGNVVKLEAVEETSDFLIEIMPIMFIPATVGLIEAWATLSAIWLKVCSIMVITTILVMVTTGRVTQYVRRHGMENAMENSDEGVEN